MNRLFTLGTLVIAACVVAPASYAGSIGSKLPKPSDKTLTVRAAGAVQADSTLRVVPSGLPVRSASLTMGLQTLLAYGPTSGDFYALPADTTPSEKKKQVKKTDLEGTEPHKEDGQTSVVEEDDDEDESFWVACLVGIVEGIIETLCGGIFGGGSESQAVVSGSGGATVVSTPGVKSLAAQEEFPYPAVVRPLRADDDDVSVWDSPGDTTDARNMGTLRRGASVMVAERVTRYGAQDSVAVVWVKVEPVDTPQPGWVLAKEVARTGVAPVELPDRRAIEPAAAAPPRQSTGESAPTRDIADSRWQIAVGISAPIFGEQDVRDEYGKNAWRVGLESKALLGGSFQVGGSLGYLRSNGETLFAYVGDSTNDSPVSDRLEIWDFGMSFGQLFSFGGGGAFFTYGVGPGVFHVRERAEIEVLEGEIVVDTRTDKLSAWKIGGTADVSIGGLAGGRIPIAFQLRFCVFPWDGDEEKSLTLDYLESSVIYYFGLGMTIGIVFF